jgi:hypothetical protein
MPAESWAHGVGFAGQVRTSDWRAWNAADPHALPPVAVSRSLRVPALSSSSCPS